MHPGALALTLLVAAFATAGTSVAFAAVFVLTRNAYTFTNSLSYPLYLLGGVFVPVAFLPNVIQPVASLVFMSWSADLLRASLKAAADRRLLAAPRHRLLPRRAQLRDRPGAAPPRHAAHARERGARGRHDRVGDDRNVMHHAFRAGLADYRAIFTWKSWLAGWMVRVIAQVAFFALIGERLDDDQKTYYLLVGNAILVAALTGVFSLNMTTAERGPGRCRSSSRARRARSSSSPRAARTSRWTVP